VTNHELEEEYMGPFKGKPIGGAMSKSHSQSKWQFAIFARVFLLIPLSRFDTTLKRNKIICVGWWAVIKINIVKILKGCSRLCSTHKGYLPSLEKAEHALLSIALGKCILMSFLFLGYFCKSVYTFDICNLSHQLIKNSSQSERVLQ
jgi:hypothetical protein